MRGDQIGNVVLSFESAEKARPAFVSEDRFVIKGADIIIGSAHYFFLNAILRLERLDDIKIRRKIF